MIVPRWATPSCATGDEVLVLVTSESEDDTRAILIG